MKKVINFVVIMMVVSVVYADGHRHGRSHSGHGYGHSNVAGAVLTTLVGAAIVSDIISDRHTTVYETVPVNAGYYRPCGYYRTIQEQVWVPGETYRIWVEERRVWNNYEEMVYPAHYEYRTNPGHYEIVTRQVWVNY